MHNRLNKEDWLLIWLFCGGIIGAGFASGRELLQYFARFGTVGLLSCFLALCGFGVLLRRLCVLCRRYHLRSQRDFVQHIVPPRLRQAADFIFCGFQFVMLVAMFSGSGALVREQLGWPPLCGILACAAVVWLFCAQRSGGLFTMQRLLLPPLLAVILLVAVLALLQMPEQPAVSVQKRPAQAVLPALLYVSYNMGGSLSVLLAVAPYAARASRGVPYVGASLLLAPAMGIVAALLKHAALAESYHLPMLYLAYLSGSGFFYAYGAVLAAAILTTALANAYALTSRFFAPDRVGWRRRWLVVQSVIIAAALPLSLVEFPAVVGYFYGVFAILFLPILVMLFGKRE